MKTIAKSGGWDGEKMSWAFWKEVGKQVFYALTCFCLFIFWIITAILVVTWGDLPRLTPDVFRMLIWSVVFIAGLIAALSYLFFSVSPEVMKEITGTFKNTAFNLTLIPAIRKLVGKIRTISRLWQKS